MRINYFQTRYQPHLILFVAFFAVGFTFNVRHTRQIDLFMERLEESLLRSVPLSDDYHMIPEVSKDEVNLTVYGLPGEVFFKLDTANQLPIKKIVTHVDSNSSEHDNSNPILDFDDEKVVLVLENMNTLSVDNHDRILRQDNHDDVSDDFDDDDSLEDDKQ